MVALLLLSPPPLHVIHVWTANSLVLVPKMAVGFIPHSMCIVCVYCTINIINRRQRQANVKVNANYGFGLYAYLEHYKIGTIYMSARREKKNRTMCTWARLSVLQSDKHNFQLKLICMWCWCYWKHIKWIKRLTKHCAKSDNRIVYVHIVQWIRDKDRESERKNNTK